MHPSDFDRLYHTSAFYLRQLIFSVTKDLQNTEDILQEVYLAAWLRFRSGDHPNPMGWLMLTAKHKAYDYLRHNRQEAKYSFTDDLSTEKSVINNCLYATDPQLDAVCEDPGSYGRIAPLLRREELSLLVEHYELGFSVTELAGRRNLSPAACHMRIHRAKKKLDILFSSDKPQHCP